MFNNSFSDNILGGRQGSHICRVYLFCNWNIKKITKFWICALMTKELVCKHCCPTLDQQHVQSSLKFHAIFCSAVLLECLLGDSSFFSTIDPPYCSLLCSSPVLFCQCVWSVCKACWFKAFPLVIPAV